MRRRVDVHSRQGPFGGETKVRSNRGVETKLGMPPPMPRVRLAAHSPVPHAPTLAYFRGMKGGAWITIGPLLLTVLAVAVGWWASSLPPAPLVVEKGAWSYDPVTDPMGAARLVVIAAGLAWPLLVALFGVGIDPRDRRNLLPATLVGGCALACFAFGWRNTPYWANGVYRSDLGEFAYIDMDPKALPPMSWIGELWRLPVLFFPLILFVMSASVFPLVGWAWQNERARVRPLLAVLVVGVAWIPLFWRVRDYTAWLMD